MDDDGINRDLLIGLEGRDQRALGRAIEALLAEVGLHGRPL